MALEQIIIQGGNTLGRFAQSVQEKALIIVYGEEQEVLDIVFTDEAEKKLFLETLPKITKKPTLNGMVKTLQVVNTYDVCNPLNLAVNYLTRPGSVVGDALGGVQGKIREVVNVFRGSNIISSPQLREAFVSPEFDLETQEFEEVGSMEFQTTRKVGLIVPFNGDDIINNNKPISRGSYVTLTQTDDPKWKMYSMKGTIDSFITVSEPISGIEYVINIDSMGPIPEPPYQTDQKGNLIKDSVGRPIPRKFSNWQIESESKISGDSRELAVELNTLTSALREIGIADLLSSFKDAPTTLPGIGNILKPLEEIAKIIDTGASTATGIANVTGTAAGALDGGLTTEEIISRVRIFRDFYLKILPFTNLSFTIQEIFKKEIASINSVLRNAIPYEQLAQIVKIVSNLARYVLGIVNIILAALKIINSAIKTIMIVLKIVKIILKILRTLIKFLPARWSTVGKIESITNKLKGWEEAIQRAITILKNISDILQNLIGTLTLVKRYLVLLVKESAIFAAKLESCSQLNNKDLSNTFNDANRNIFEALKNLIQSVPQVQNLGDRSTTGANALNDGITTFTFGSDGSIIALNDTVFGYDEFGNIIFYGDLISGATGVNFENTLGQEFRSNLRYYTFNKFKESQKGLLELADKTFIDSQNIADPEDVFGNFQELYLGYTLKIQEEKLTDPSSNNLIRRRGIALASDEQIIVSTELTYSTDLTTIVNELKYKLERNLNQGLIGINTTDKGQNQISNDDALNLSETIGVNPIGLNNEKATANNRAVNNIAGQQLEPSDPRETRIGNQPFTPDGEVGDGAQIISNNSSNARDINLGSLIAPIITQAEEEDPELQAIRDIFDTLGSVNTGNISKILSEPGSQNLTDEELVSKLKSSILSGIDPNPDKVEEIKNKTQQWYEGLQKQTKIDWEQLYLQSLYLKRSIPPYEVYYDNIEKQELPKWIIFLLRNRYTETEIDYGISQDKIRDKYKIVIKDDGTVEVTLRP